jgi:hypothetical protein
MSLNNQSAYMAGLGPWEAELATIDQAFGPVHLVKALQVGEGVQEQRCPEIDARRDGDLSEEVEPAGGPGPGGPVLRRDLGGPVVRAMTAIACLAETAGCG